MFMPSRSAAGRSWRRRTAMPVKLFSAIGVSSHPPLAVFLVERSLVDFVRNRRYSPDVPRPNHRRCQSRSCAISLVDGIAQGVEEERLSHRGRVRTPANCRWKAATYSQASSTAGREPVQAPRPQRWRAAEPTAHPGESKQREQTEVVGGHADPEALPLSGGRLREGLLPTKRREAANEHRQSPSRQRQR